jgi:hypothetical protein
MPGGSEASLNSCLIEVHASMQMLQHWSTSFNYWSTLI